MAEITKHASVCTRTQRLVIGDAFELPSGIKPHIFGKDFKSSKGGVIRKIHIDVAIHGVSRTTDGNIIQITLFIDDLDEEGVDHEFHFARVCEQDVGTKEYEHFEELMIEEFNLIVEELVEIWTFISRNQLERLTRSFEQYS